MNHKLTVVVFCPCMNKIHEYIVELNLKAITKGVRLSDDSWDHRIIEYTFIGEKEKLLEIERYIRNLEKDRQLYLTELQDMQKYCLPSPL